MTATGDFPRGNTASPTTSTGGHRRHRASLLAAVLAVCAAGPSLAQTPPADAKPWSPGRVIVLPRPGLPESELANVAGQHGGKARRLGDSGLYVVELPQAASARALAATWAHHPHFKFAEADEMVAPDFVSNDPYAGSEWHMDKIGARSAWDFAQGSGVTIAILDSGVDATHPDLAPRIVPGWNFYDNTANTADVYGHGTKVAGTAAATTNNGIGVSGVAGLSRIMPIRISDTAGYAYWSTIAQGLTYAADHGARVANISYSAYVSASVRSAAQYMKDKGGLVFVSSGNTGVADSTAATSTMIVVGATDANDLRASWSTYGPVVSLSAPGVSIYSTTVGGGYAAVSGTSFSTPMSAGVAALMMAARPSLSSSQVESLLYSTAVDLGTAGRDPYYGYGRVNAAGAVSAAAAYALPPADTQAPTASILSPTANATVSGVVNVNVSASDNIGVTRVDLIVNGTTVVSDTTAPFGFAWDSTGVANGMASLVVRAVDAAGNTKSSTAVAVNVANTTASRPTGKKGGR